MTRSIAGFGAAYPALDPDAVDFGYLRDASQALVPFGAHVGTLITEISATRSVVEIPAEPVMCNHMGTVHAGALFTAADIAGAAAFVGAAAHRLHTIDRLILRGGTAAYRKPARGRIRAVAGVEAAELAMILAATANARYGLSGRAELLDDNDVLTAEFTFDYVCDVRIAGTDTA
ncbi:YiiD C-terminal domain-containing protein [Nocardia sp. GTS18]|uniref:YiiD C-terminal domain-containing protein n=1 Tax=Nocardia sp. GTS18 TaxID=1778064 RepID=UPI0015EE54A6|nr:YiiD C-terminal domain-containing protein [Nocardia sp. GTS18]